MLKKKKKCKAKVKNAAPIRGKKIWNQSHMFLQRILWICLRQTCVHKRSEIQEIILLIFYPGRFYKDLSPPFTKIYFFCQDRKQHGEGNINALESAMGFSIHIVTFQQNQGLVFSLITYRWRKNIPNKSVPQGRILKFVKNAIWPHSVATVEWCHACCKTQNVPLRVTSKTALTRMGGLVWPLSRE